MYMYLSSPLHSIETFSVSGTLHVKRILVPKVEDPQLLHPGGPVLGNVQISVPEQAS